MKKIKPLSYQLLNQCSWEFCSQSKQHSSNWYCLLNGLEIYLELITWNNSGLDGLDTQGKVVWPRLDSTTPLGCWHDLPHMGCSDNVSDPHREGEDRENYGESGNTNKQKIALVQGPFDILRISKNETNSAALFWPDMAYPEKNKPLCLSRHWCVGLLWRQQKQKEEHN